MEYELKIWKKNKQTTMTYDTQVFLKRPVVSGITFKKQNSKYPQNDKP